MKVACFRWWEAPEIRQIIVVGAIFCCNPSLDETERCVVERTICLLLKFHSRQSSNETLHSSLMQLTWRKGPMKPSANASSLNLFHEKQCGDAKRNFRAAGCQGPRINLSRECRKMVALKMGEAWFCYPQPLPIHPVPTQIVVLM